MNKPVNQQGYSNIVYSNNEYLYEVWTLRYDVGMSRGKESLMRTTWLILVQFVTILRESSAHDITSSVYKPHKYST